MLSIYRLYLFVFVKDLNLLSTLSISSPHLVEGIDSEESKERPFGCALAMLSPLVFLVLGWGHLTPQWDSD